MRTEAQKAARAKYERSEKGKAARKKHEASYVASGKRALAEARRLEKPISEARKAAKKKWSDANSAYWAASRSHRRSLESNLSLDEFWILQEACELARLREQMLLGKWHVDHIVPVSKGGTSQPHNLQVVPACWNRRKSNKHSERFFAHAHKE
jgi:hypothetical protein